MIWGRRAILMVAVGLLIAVPVTLLIRDSGSEPERASPSETPSAAADAPGREVNDRKLEAAYLVPQGWKTARKEGVLTLRSRDGSVQVGIASPGPADGSAAVFKQAIGALRDGYESVEVTPAPQQELGGLTARSVAVRARSDNVDLRVLAAVAKGKERAYLVEVFTSTTASPKAVAEAQVLLNSLRLRG